MNPVPICGSIRARTGRLPFREGKFMQAALQGLMNEARLLQGRNPTAAAQLCRKILQADPGHFDALFMLAPLLSRFRTRLSVRYLRLAHVGNNSDQRMRIVEAIRIGVRFPKLPLIRREMLHALPPTLFLTSRFPIWHR